MNKTCFDRFSQGLAATVLLTGVVGMAGTAQAETVASAAALLEDASTGAVVSTGTIAPQEPSLFATEGFSPEAIVAQTAQPTPLDSPSQLPPPGQPVPGQPDQPGRTGAPTPLPPTTTPPPTSTPPATPPPTTRPAPPPRQDGGVQPGRATATGASYVGAGFNIGIGEGDSAVGDGSFALFSKIGLTQLLSIRPAVLFSDDVTFLVPVTFDFIPLITPATRDVGEAVGLRVSPYVGGGAAISTGDDSSVDFLLTGGVDVPVSDRLTATAQVNVTFVDNTAVGLLLGLGYNF
ncbi:MAG: hypothetical protein HC895_14285 [Leptolyngbyaceae cyanobacterium SM1_3_5]|nr:hypothetical protein [Leptolyngbyaceae cyanobacterium SM1_3_5]